MHVGVHVGVHVGAHVGVHAGAWRAKIEREGKRERIAALLQQGHHHGNQTRTHPHAPFITKLTYTCTVIAK